MGQGGGGHLFKQEASLKRGATVLLICGAHRQFLMGQTPSTAGGNPTGKRQGCLLSQGCKLQFVVSVRMIRTVMS